MLIYKYDPFIFIYLYPSLGVKHQIQLNNLTGEATSRSIQY